MTKGDLFRHLDRVRSGLPNGPEYDALKYLRRMASISLFDWRDEEEIGETIIHGIRVDPPNVDEDAPRF